jgi:hypothetical protein
MNLLCPNCQKMLQVPEQYAGQLMKCPLCTGTFTVPALPQSPAPPPPPPQQFTPPQNVPQPPPDLGMGMGPAHETAGAPLPPPAGYTHQRSYTLSSRVVSWIAPLCLIGIFVLLFFSWIGMYPAGVGVVTQSGWNAAFGGYGQPSEVWMDANRDEMDFLKNLGVSLWLVLFLLVLLPALVVALGTTLIHARLVPVELPPSLAQYWSFRPLLVSLLCLGGLVFLVLQLVSSFRIEEDAWKQAEKMAKALPGYKEPATPEQRDRFKLDTGKEYGKFNLERTGWLTLAVILAVAALLGSLLDYWAERRGPQAPPPRIDILT